jgi:hypothetical protein
MSQLVAISTQCDQILLAIVSRLTTELVMVDLKVGGTATVLASPGISPQHLLAELPVRL